jgi:hypothetical protein
VFIFRQKRDGATAKTKRSVQAAWARRAAAMACSMAA